MKLPLQNITLEKKVKIYVLRKIKTPASKSATARLQEKKSSFILVLNELCFHSYRKFTTARLKVKIFRTRDHSRMAFILPKSYKRQIIQKTSTRQKN